MVVVKFVRAVQEAELPAYGSAGASGMDLRSVEVVTLQPGERRLIDTGLLIELPRGYEGQVRPRSGLALKHGITVVNAPGTIDWDYRGRIGVILLNTSTTPFHIGLGDRIAQLVIAPVVQALVAEIREDELTTTERGAGGYGSTGAR
jgi:dUTP pyrophosphatase